jgi:hypothetical protein
VVLDARPYCGSCHVERISVARSSAVLMQVLAAARVWLPAARLEVKLSASVRLVRMGIRTFRPRNSVSA